MRYRHTAAVLGMMAACLMAGCSTQSRTVRTERLVETVPEEAPAAAPRVRVEERASTTTRRQERPQGVLGSVVHLVGEILSLPFRLIGGLIRLIF